MYIPHTWSSILNSPVRVEFSENDPERYLKRLTKGHSGIEWYEQHPKWGPPFLSIIRYASGYELESAYMLHERNDYRGPEKKDFKTPVYEDYYDPKGYWVDSQFAYLMQESMLHV